MQLSPMIGAKYDEPVIIAKILKFVEFEGFYRVEWASRKERGALIDWYINPLCKAYAAQGFDVGKGKPWVQLRRLPETIDDAFLTAHEIEHVIRWFEGQYLDIKINGAIEKNYVDGTISDLAFTIGSMFDDPVVDKFLQNRYNFNTTHRYTEVVIPDTIKSLNSSRDSEFDIYRLIQSLFYSQCALQWDSIKDDKALRKWHALKRQYQNKRPRVKGMGEELYSMAKENGYDTLEKQKQLFHKIVDKYTIDGYKLSDILYIE